jgi:FMN-dependent NADH-azoreductase
MGKLVKMEEGQFIGLAKAKSATVVVTRGGTYSPGSGAEAYDQQEGHLRVILGFIGITDVNIVYCENLASDESSQNEALEKAKADVAAAAAAVTRID